MFFIYDIYGSLYYELITQDGKSDTKPQAVPIIEENCRETKRWFFDQGLSKQYFSPFRSHVKSCKYIDQEGLMSIREP